MPSRRLFQKAYLLSASKIKYFRQFDEQMRFDQFSSTKHSLPFRYNNNNNCTFFIALYINGAAYIIIWIHSKLCQLKLVHSIAFELNVYYYLNSR